MDINDLSWLGTGKAGVGNYDDLYDDAVYGSFDDAVTNLLDDYNIPSGVLPETWAQSGDGKSFLEKAWSGLADAAKAKFLTPGGTPNWVELAKAALAAKTLYDSSKSKSGSAGTPMAPIQPLTMVRERVPQATESLPYGAGRMGQRYFSDTTFMRGVGNTAPGTTQEDAAAALAAAQERARAQAQSLARPAFAAGGIASLAAGGAPREPRYLNGPTNGQSDEIETSIDGEQPALLSHGEFVIPADIVSSLGAGNSEAGADVLYKMMDRVRQSATGTTRQMRPVDERKVLPI
jgi:hypothetical protein